ncbi:MAG: MAPEG family protein [Gammaproteobacteria bacterium]
MEGTSPILAPAAALVVWSLIMLGWLVVARLPALKAAGIDLGSNIGGRGQDVEAALPPSVNWKSHNYTHLMEQPTLFYATVMILALAGAGDGLNLQLAWAYTGLRVLHSIVQATWNRVLVRFLLFSASTVVLLALAINALRATL